MAALFGERIEEYILSADTIDKDTFENLIDLVDEYISRELDGSSMQIFERVEAVNNEIGLRRRGRIGEQSTERISNLRDIDGHHSSLAAVSFDFAKPLWVQGTAGLPLATADNFEDTWSGQEIWPREDAPPNYRSEFREDIRSCVIHPIIGYHETRPLGVMEIRSTQLHAANPVAKHEIARLSSIIGRASLMVNEQREQQRTSKQAFSAIKESLGSSAWPQLALPKVFVATPAPDKLEPLGGLDVYECLRRVLDEFSDEIEAVFGNEIQDSGPVSENLAETISQRSDFGICYFSQPSDRPAPPLNDSSPEDETLSTRNFEDNLNVLYEAGMMKGCKAARGGVFRDWIPVREGDSPPPPFDIAGESTIIPERELADGALTSGSGGSLETLLRARLRKLVS